jgi:hypothetical protein
MVFNATFNIFSAISWWSVLLVEETKVPGENLEAYGIQTYFVHIKLYEVDILSFHTKINL